MVCLLVTVGARSHAVRILSYLDMEMLYLVPGISGSSEFPNPPIDTGITEKKQLSAMHVQ